MSQLKRLIREIHRRSVWQALGIYILGASVGYQAIQSLTEGLRLPEWFPALALVLFIVGLPIVLATAFMQEGLSPAIRRDPTLLPEAHRGGTESAVEPTHREFEGARRLFTWRNAIVGGMAAFALWGVVAAGWLLLTERTAQLTDSMAASRKMLAVLPFENLGRPEDEYFADGITEEITARLAAIPGLGVIARTSAIQYKGTNLAVGRIGDELGVDYILEGTVRWAHAPDGTSRVRVTPQLIQVEDATHVWANIYEEALADVFQVQSDIAGHVTDALGVTLLDPGQRALAAAPTENLAAYDYYLQGNDYYNRRGGENERIAAQMYEKAIELDPNFALAYAKLAIAYSAQFVASPVLGLSGSEITLARAKAAIDRALQLEPGLPEAHMALGYYYYWGHLDYEPALEQFALAQQSHLNSSDLFHLIAAVQRRQGKMEQAVANFKQAAELDPRSAHMAVDIGSTYYRMRRFSEAERYLDRAISLGPEVPAYYGSKASLYLSWNADKERARQVIEDASAKIDPAQILVHVGTAFDRFRPLLRILGGDYQEELSRLTLASSELDTAQYFLVRAEGAAWTQQSRLARAYYDSAATILETRARLRPDAAGPHIDLAHVYAGLGRFAEAVREGEKALQLLPVTKDARDGPQIVADLAEIYAMAGQHDAAIDRLESVLSVPYYMSAALLRVDPIWDPLRDHPRFQQLLEGES